MDLSRYAARLSSVPVRQMAPELIVNKQGSESSTPVAPPRFGPSSVGSAGFSMLPFEPEDARLTGGTRSLSRRLLGLNLTGRIERPGTYKNRSDSSAA
jgi:hypothetical protein